MDSNSHQQLINLLIYYNQSFSLSNLHFINMHVFTMTATGSLAILSLVQFSPVPTSVIGAIVGGLDGGAISGGIVAGTKNHHHALPPGVSKESLDQCTQQINFQGGPVNVYSTGDDCRYPRLFREPSSSMNSLTFDSQSSCSCQQCSTSLYEPGFCSSQQPCPGRWPCSCSHGDC